MKEREAGHPRLLVGRKAETSRWEAPTVVQMYTTQMPIGSLCVPPLPLQA